MTAALFEADNDGRRREVAEIARYHLMEVDKGALALFTARGKMVEVARATQPTPVEVPKHLTGQIMRSEIQPEVLQQARQDATHSHQNRNNNAAQASQATPALERPVQSAPETDPVAAAREMVQAAHGTKAELDEARAQLESEINPQSAAPEAQTPQIMNYEAMDEAA